MSAVVTLFRPVGPEELTLIEQSGWKRFPPRLPEQPIFYPVVQEAYAVKIARDWNARQAGSGFVTKFEVDASWLAQFEPQYAGGREHAEYWIPAERMEDFNDHIVGAIEVVAEFQD
jgi:hypothetical protein